MNSSSDRNATVGVTSAVEYLSLAIAVAHKHKCDVLIPIATARAILAQVLNPNAISPHENSPPPLSNPDAATMKDAGRGWHRGM